jgi:S-DNA-T family DNA segregation ATPase FtsK/SpoIIIE
VDACGECGFVYDDLAVTAIAGAVRSLPRAYAERLTEGDASVRSHPLPDVWSALEYACHVRDVLVVQGERLAQALAQDRPDFTPMRREERVTEERYNTQDVAVVLEQLRDAAHSLADAMDALDDRGWSRVAVHPWPVRRERTMAWLGRHTVHEGVHHLGDVERVLSAAAGERTRPLRAARSRR